MYFESMVVRITQKMLRTCKLCCVQNSHKPINLPHKETITVGRSHDTGIKDSALSRFQVKLVADLESCTVKAIPVGTNPSGVNGYCLKQNSEYTLKHKDRIELLLDQYVHEIVFDPDIDSLDNSNVGTLTNKRRRDDDMEGNDSFKQQKFDVKPQKSKSWEEIDAKKLIIFTPEGCLSKSKIAAYDMDGTIISTKSGARFPKDKDDWQFAFAEIPKKLREMDKNDYKVVIFTNQAGIGLGRIKIGDLKHKIETIISKLEIPVQVFISPTRSLYRKPAPGMWNALCKEKNDGLAIDVSKSFYVGDAAGRDKNWAPKKKKDHSIADRLFALNIGVDFYTPEEHFLGARKIQHLMPEFDPRQLTDLPLCQSVGAKITSEKQEVVIFVGFPGSGKSFFCIQHLVPKGYVHINRDKLGSWQKCVSAMEKYLQEGKSVVIDNTNPDSDSRKRYVTAAKNISVSCRCFVMTTSIHQAKHNNFFREITDSTHQQVTDIIINSYKTKYQEPKLEEGYAEILFINCAVQFDSSEHRELYHKFLLEK